MITYKVWLPKEKVFMDVNFGKEWYNKKMGSYDCFPDEKTAKRVASRIVGKGNYVIKKFKLEEID